MNSSQDREAEILEDTVPEVLSGTLFRAACPKEHPGVEVVFRDRFLCLR